MNVSKLLIYVIIAFVIYKLTLSKESFGKGSGGGSSIFVGDISGTVSNMATDFWEGSHEREAIARAESQLKFNEWDLQGLFSTAKLKKFYLLNPESGKCVHAGRYASSVTGDVLSFHEERCGHYNTLFTMDKNGILRSLNGKCISAYWNGGYNGALLETNENYCDQPFEFVNGVLRHKNSGRCIHPDGGWANNDTRLVTWDGCWPENRINLFPVLVDGFSTDTILEDNPQDLYTSPPSY